MFVMFLDLFTLKITQKHKNYKSGGFLTTAMKSGTDQEYKGGWQQKIMLKTEGVNMCE